MNARDDRAPPNPARFPATDKSWHGNPPDQISALGMSSDLIAVMSPKLGVSGQWRFKTADAYGSISECDTVRIPAR